MKDWIEFDREDFIERLEDVYIKGHITKYEYLREREYIKNLPKNVIRMDVINKVIVR